MKFRPPLSYLSALFIVTLIILNGCLLKQNISYSNQNRELILQNDSLIAVTIELSKGKAEPVKAIKKPIKK